MTLLQKKIDKAVILYISISAKPITGKSKLEGVGQKR